MPGFLLHTSAVMQCFHQAPAVTAPTSKVLVSGQAVATTANLITVTGCPFSVPPPVGPKAQPCVKIDWTMIATRVRVNGSAVLLQAGPGTGVGVCRSVEGIPQGLPTVGAMQGRVSGL